MMGLSLPPLKRGYKRMRLEGLQNAVFMYVCTYRLMCRCLCVFAILFCYFFAQLFVGSIDRKHRRLLRPDVRGKQAVPQVLPGGELPGSRGQGCKYDRGQGCKQQIGGTTLLFVPWHRIALISVLFRRDFSSSGFPKRFCRF